MASIAPFTGLTVTLIVAVRKKEQQAVSMIGAWLCAGWLEVLC